MAGVNFWLTILDFQSKAKLQKTVCLNPACVFDTSRHGNGWKTNWAFPLKGTPQQRTGRV